MPGGAGNASLTTKRLHPLAASRRPQVAAPEKSALLTLRHGFQRRRYWITLT